MHLVCRQFLLRDCEAHDETRMKAQWPLAGFTPLKDSAPLNLGQLKP